MKRVSVYEDREKKEVVVARVRYNELLDRWNGSGWSNGGVGMHKGVTRLKDGRYVIIVGSDWQDGRDYGYIASPSEVLKEIIYSGNKGLLEMKMFSELKMML